MSRQLGLFNISLSPLAVIMAFHTCHHGNLVRRYLLPSCLWEQHPFQQTARQEGPFLFSKGSISACLYCWGAPVPFEKLSRFPPLSKFWLLEVRWVQWRPCRSLFFFRDRNFNVFFRDRTRVGVFKLTITWLRHLLYCSTTKKFNYWFPFLSF